MSKTIAAPTSLISAVKYFADKDVALAFLAGMRWPQGVACPHCDAKEPSFLKSRRIWKCKACRKQFSVKVGTIFEDSAIGLDKWLPALWMLANCKNGISSYELGRSLGVTQKTAWFMLHRIRLAMQSKTFKKFSGHVEADETFIGGRASNMHWNEKRRVIKRSRTAGKTAVMGLLERHSVGNAKRGSQVKVSVTPDVSRYNLQCRVFDAVEQGSHLYTDALKSYRGLGKSFQHEFIDHAESYAQGAVHTNGLENFWSLLKRTLKGTYVSVEPFHLFRYLDEQAFRFNNRKTKDVCRFIDMVRGILGKRLTYAQLTGLATT